MADVNLPSANDLGTMMSLPFPAYQQMQNQIGLANQFQQQNLQKGSEEINATKLANIFSAQANPLKIQGLQSDTDIKGVNSRNALANEDVDRIAAREKAIASASEDQLKSLGAQAEKDLMSDDPAVQAKGLKKYMASKAELDRRNKQSDKLEQIGAEGKNSANVANIHAGATIGAAKIMADSRMQAAAAKQKQIGDINALVLSGKLTPDKAAVAFHAQAMTTQDPVEQQQYMQQAAQYEKMAMNLRTAGVQGKPDIGSITGLPTTQLQPALGAAPPTAPKAANTPSLPPGWTLK